MSWAGSNSPYPWPELRRARDDFRAQWYKACNRDPRVRDIDALHHHSPPNIRMINWSNYPFARENAVRQMPVPFHFNLNIPFTRLPPQPLMPTTSWQQPPWQLDTLDPCRRLTEDVLFEPRAPQRPVIESTFFECDECLYEGQSVEEAQLHLQTAKHESCSKMATFPGVDGDQVTVLSEARVVFNDSVPSLAWMDEKEVVVCPMCYLVFPDKLMCAYHHQSQHEGLSAHYSFAPVLSIRHIQISPYPLFCFQCNTTFRTLDEYTLHWVGPSSTCSSPFYPVTVEDKDHGATDSQTPHNPYQQQQIVQVYCHTCHAWFDRVSPPLKPDSGDPSSSSYEAPEAPVVLPYNLVVQSGRKRRSVVELGRVDNDAAIYHRPRRQVSNPNTVALVTWADSFARFCVNHARRHHGTSKKQRRRLDSNSSVAQPPQSWDQGRLTVRCVALPTPSQMRPSPPFRCETDKDLLLFCINECKRLLHYLTYLRTTRHSLQRRAQDKLTQLLALVTKEEGTS